RRVENLPLMAREVLELICIAVQPLLLPMIFAAANLAGVEQQGEAIGALVRDNLARILGSGKDRKAEAFHDQVRNAVTNLMNATLRRRRHAQLAQTLAALPQIEPQTL